MIAGIVSTALEPIVQLVIHGPAGHQKQFDALIDTGFDGWLSLPVSIISDLELQWRGRASALLADGTRTVFNVYEGTLIWHDQPRRIRVDEAETDPLVG